MALQKGRVAIPLSKGINQKIDPKQEPPGSLKELENIQVDKFGEIEKREGYNKVQDEYGYNYTDLKKSITDIQSITSLKDDLYILTNNKALSNNPGLGKAIFEGKYSPASIETKHVEQQTSYYPVHHNLVVKADYAYSVYSLQLSSTTSAIYLTVKNIKDNTPFITQATISTTAFDRPKIVSLGDKIVKFAIKKDGTNYFIGYNMSSPLSYTELTTDFSSAFNSISQTHADKIYDVSVNESEDCICLVHKTTAGKAEIISLFLNIAPAAADILQSDASFTSGSSTISAVGVTPITSNPKKNGVPTSTEDQGGFAVAYADANALALLTFDKFATNIHINSGFSHSGSGTGLWDLAIAPKAIIPMARDNNFTSGGTNGLAYDVYVDFSLSSTGTGTSNDKLFVIDNRTGTYASQSFTTTTFSSNYVNAMTSATSIWSPVSYADFPSCNKQRISVWRHYADLDGTSAGDFTKQFSCVTGTITAKPYLVDGNPILPIGKRVDNQDAYYLWSVEDYDTGLNIPVGVMSYGTAETYYPYDSTLGGLSGVPGVSIDSDGHVHIPTNQKGRIESNDGSFFTFPVPSITKVSYDFSVANQNEQVAGNLIVAGSQLFSSDQMRFQEHNFVQGVSALYVYSESLTTTGTNHPFVQNGVYNYYAAFRYEDHSGNIHRSSLSPQFSFQLGSTTNYQNIDILIPMVNFTAKYEYATFIELYRTTNGGTLFYKVSDQNLTTSFRANRNQRDHNYILIRDTITDDDLQDNELLYTTGGVLENSVAPAASIMASYKNRLFLAGIEPSDHLIYFSKSIQGNVYDTTPVEFSDSLTLEVPTDGGAIVALKKMDDKLIIFKERAIYMLTGEGPNNLGEQNDFIEPQLITSDIGCKFANSVAFMPKGLMFMSQKGIFLLNRSLGIEYIGAPAEDYRDLTITKTTVVPKKSEVRFLASDGPTAIYNYLLNMWYTYTDHRGNSSCLVGDDYFLASYKDKIYKQVSTTSSFDGAIVPMKVETGWLSFAGIQGFQRVYRMLLLGEYKSPHKLLIKIAYNYDDVWQQEKLVDVTSYTESYTYGSPSTGTQNTYGDPSGTSAIAYGGKDNTQYQIRLNFAKQKCESIKICIEEIEGSNSSGDAESAGPGFTLSNLSFIVGTKEGDFKIKQSRVFGSTSIT